MPIYYWPLLRSVIGRDTFSTPAPVLGPEQKTAGYVTLSHCSWRSAWYQTCDIRVAVFTLLNMPQPRDFKLTNIPKGRLVPDIITIWIWANTVVRAIEVSYLCHMYNFQSWALAKSPGVYLVVCSTLYIARIYTACFQHDREHEHNSSIRGHRRPSKKQHRHVCAMFCANIYLLEPGVHKYEIYPRR